MKTPRKLAAMVAAASAVALAASACSSGQAEEQPAPPATTAAAATWSQPVQFWGWAPGYDEAVKLWNEKNPGKKVAYEQISAGSKGGYQKMLTAVKAGNAPCLAQVGYETFTSFLAAGALEDATTELASAKSAFPEWVWNQVTVDAKSYGVPVDTGPMAMFYRADKFRQAGLELPTTWEEFKAAAVKVKKHDPAARLTNFGTDVYNYAGFPWQAGAKWFGTEADAWTVSINSEQNKKVAAYWQDLIDSDLVTKHPSWEPALYQAWDKGTVWSEVGAVWTAGLLKSEVKGSSGQWAVAPMPVWSGEQAVGNSGGSATALLKGCKAKAEAAEFAAWMSSDPAAWGPLADKGGMYPASTGAITSEAFSTGDEFFGGQKIYDVFKAEAAKVNQDWQWGPAMTVTAQVFGDGLGQVQTGKMTVAAVLDDTQAKTIAEIKKQGYSVKE